MDTEAMLIYGFPVHPDRRAGDVAEALQGFPETEGLIVDYAGTGFDSVDLIPLVGTHCISTRDVSLRLREGQFLDISGPAGPLLKAAEVLGVPETDIGWYLAVYSG